MVEFEYKNGRRRKMAEPYANVLAKAGLGYIVVQQPVYQTKVLTPDHEETEISPRTGKPKRQYKRRDMKAED